MSFRADTSIRACDFHDHHIVLLVNHICSRYGEFDGDLLSYVGFIASSSHLTLDVKSKIGDGITCGTRFKGKSIYIPEIIEIVRNRD